MSSGDPIRWYPARMLRDRAEGEDPAHRRRFALIILNQPLRDVKTLSLLWKNASLTVAADGGANRLLDVCKSDAGNVNKFDNLDVIIGDLDSLTQEARDFFTTPSPGATKRTRIIHDPDQYSTDFGKAVKHIRDDNDDDDDAARRAGGHDLDGGREQQPPPPSPADIVAMGSLGGRVDQGLSQLHHLYLYQTSPDYAEGRMFLVSGESLTFLLKAGRHLIHVRETRDREGEDVFAKYVGIIPIREPSVISTRGLEWDVTDWETEFGGMMSTSNHVLPETEVVEVETTKDVLFTIALKG